ncbi:MAG: DUF3304 domain-containing protein [Azonexaceae bacterium]|nr:DUF3304 domain-containing protein [Azonexaceae bacterium]
MKRLAQYFLLALAVFLAQGCDKPGNTKPEGSASSITGYNYTADGIAEFFVNGAWGGGLGIGSDYGNVCCVMLPDKWTPGLSATVEWRRTDCGGLDDQGRIKCYDMEIGTWPKKTLKKEVPIEPYDHPGAVQVMFLPNDEVKIYAVPFDPDHPDHPAKLGPPRPLEYPEWKR